MDFLQAAKELLELAVDTKTGDETVQQACQRLFAAFGQSTDEEEQQGMSALASGLHCERGAYLALVCGSLIEHGANPLPLRKPLLERVTPLIEKAAQLIQVRSHKGEGTDEQKAAWNTLEKFRGPITALLSADSRARTEAQKLHTEVDLLSSDHIVGHWMSLLLKVLDNELLLVIEPERSLGFVGRMSGIVDNHQLHVLLMDKFPGAETRRVSEQAVAIARGLGPQETNEHIVGRWNMYSWKAWSGSLSNDQENWIWGEGNPCDIPVFDEHRVVLLGPPAYKRGWTSGRAFGLLRADVKVTKELCSDEIAAWLAMMAEAN